MRLRRRRLLVRHIRGRHRLLDDRPDRLSGDAIERVQPTLFGGHRDHLPRTARDRHVGDERRRRHVEVPDRMVHELEVPLALAGFQIDARKRFGKQVVAGPMAAVVIGAGRLNRQIHEPGVFVHSDLRPHADVAVRRPRLLFPRVVAELARPRNRVELPQLLAGPSVERARKAFRIVVSRHRRAFAHRRSDDDHVLDDERRRVDANLARLEIDLLALAFHDAEFQIDDAVLAERRHRRAGLRVQFDEPIAGRHIHNALVALAVSPVRNAAAGELARRYGGALAFAHAVDPDDFARLAVERHHVAPRAAGGIEHPPNRKRRPLQLVFGESPEIVRLEAPRHLELAEVRGVDLIERRIPRPSDIRRIVRPISILRRRQTGRLGLKPYDRQHERQRNAAGCSRHLLPP